MTDQQIDLEKGRRVMSDRDPGGVRAETSSAAGANSTVRKGRRLQLIAMFSVPLLLLSIGAYLWLSSGRYVSTDDAYVEQNMVSIAPEVGGRVVRVFVQENQSVRLGQLLFQIDPRPYRIALEQAQAQIADAGVQVDELQAKRAGTTPDIKGAAANLATMERAFAREAVLLQQGFTTRASYDAARQSVDDARQRLADARSQAAQAHAAMRPGGALDQPVVLTAQAARDQAALNLARTIVRAPAAGRVSQSDDLQVGTQALAGVPLATIVRDNSTYIVANFNETDLTNMRVGLPAAVTFDAYPHARFKGRVASIGAGTGSQFSLLPAQNATGNWVKVTQRVPVRIAIEGGPDRQMIAGLSASVTVDTRNPQKRR